MPILSSLSVLGAHFSTPPSGSPWYADSSSAYHTVTLNGSVTQSDEGGGVKAALLGSDGYFSTTLNDDLGSGDFTVEAWVKSDSYTSSKYLIDARAGSIWALGWGLDGVYDGLISIYDGSFTKSSIQTIPYIWSHVAVVRNSGIISIYINGQTAVANADSSSFTGTGTLTIGARYTHDSGQFFTGAITGLRIVQGVAVYTSDFSVPTALLTAVSGTKLLLNFGASAVPTV